MTNGTSKNLIKRPATISDVARESNVSIATVSYVVNNGPRNVSPETRARVKRAMEELKYHPNSIARALTQKRLNTIGIVFPHPHPNLVADSYFSTLLDGIISVAVKRQQHVMLYTGLEWHGSDSLPAFRDRRVDGFIVIAALVDSDLVPSLVEADIPFVQINGGVYPQRTVNVDVDNVDAVHQAISHLASLGHRRIAHLGGQANSPSTVPRRQAFIAAMNEHGLPIDYDLILERSYDKEWGCDGMNRLLSLPVPPTAVFAGGDGIAVGAYIACANAGVSIPNEMSIVGFDDALYAGTLNPPLTTVRHPLTEIATMATTLLLDQLLEEPGQAAQNESIKLPAELVLRRSTGPAKT